MKGRTKCPKCEHEFVLDAPKEYKKHRVNCPKCNHKFNIRPASIDSKLDDDCLWEEYGEPRKTVLSSIRPKTDKPFIATILLSFVFVIGIASATFPETLIEAPLATLSNVGMSGSIELTIVDQSNKPLYLRNISVTINDASTISDINGSYNTDNVTLGIAKVELSHPQYKTLTCEVPVVPFIASSHKIIMENGNGDKYIPFNTIGCSAIIAIFSIFALIAALMSLKRKHLDVAVVGSILGIFSFGFFLVGSIISIIALAIILNSREEFQDGKKGKVF